MYIPMGILSYLEAITVVLGVPVGRGCSPPFYWTPDIEGLPPPE
jgi:hypothetical protein